MPRQAFCLLSHMNIDQIVNYIRKLTNDLGKHKKEECRLNRSLPDVSVRQVDHIKDVSPIQGRENVHTRNVFNNTIPESSITKFT